MSIETKILHCCQVPVEDARFITESNVKGLRPCGGPIQARSNGHSLSLPGDPTPTSLPSIVREKLYTKPDVVIRPIYAPDFKNQRCVFHENSTMAANGLLCSKTEQVQRHDLNAFKVDQQSLNTLYHAAMASEARLLPENNPFSAEEQRAYQDHMKTSSSDHHTSSAEKTPCNATDTRRCGECGRTISRANLARHLRYVWLRYWAIHTDHALDSMQMIVNSPATFAIGTLTDLTDLRRTCALMKLLSNSPTRRHVLTPQTHRLLGQALLSDCKYKGSHAVIDWT